MYQNRLTKLKTMMAENSLSALFISAKENRFYFSGFRGSAGSLLIFPEAQYLFTDSRYTLQAAAEAKDFTLLPSGKGFYDKLKELLIFHGAKTVGFEDTVMTYADFQKISGALPDFRWVPIGNKAARIRQIKDTEEIRRIRIAEEIGDRAFARVTKEMHAGMTEKEVAFLLEDAMRKDGAEGFSFDTIVAAGERSALPHASPTDRALQNGEFVVMDFGCVYEGYCSDMTRTVAIGYASDYMKEVYGILLHAQKQALNSARVGMGAKDLDAVARNALATSGYDKYFGHSLGHGVGIRVHEAPTAAPSSEDILLPGMTVTVEPGVYFEGKFGIRIEDLIVFTETGTENLTHSPKELLILS